MFNLKEEWIQRSRIHHTSPDCVLHIDRPLPFMVIYEGSDVHLMRLVKSEASYIIVHRFTQEVEQLLRSLAQLSFAEFGAFLLFELRENTSVEVDAARVRIVTPRTRISLKALDTLEQSLVQMRLHTTSPLVKHVFDASLFKSLFPSSFAKKNSVYVMCLEFNSFFRNGKTVYPILLNRFHRGLSRSLRQTFFAFSQNTSHEPSHYLALGPRALSKTVWQVDRELTSIAESFDLVLEVTPINVDAAWSDFKKSKFKTDPTFHYHPLPVDPAFLKKKLYDIPVDRVEDPTLHRLFHHKRRELDRQITMLSDRNTSQFLHGSIQLYGAPAPSLIASAKKLLRLTPKQSASRVVGAQQAAALARREIAFYHKAHSFFSAKVELRDDASGMMVSKDTLIISSTATFAANRLNALLQHEVGTHILTYVNGRDQKFSQLYAGLAAYEEFQEGLAVIAEFLSGGLTHGRMRLLAARVLTVDYLLRGKSFVQSFNYLLSYKFPPRQAFTICMRVYRGGGLTKDAMYLRGLQSMLEYLKSGNDFTQLFIGKITPDSLPVVSELQLRQVLHRPRVLPRYLSESSAQLRLAKLKEGCSLLDLL